MFLENLKIAVRAIWGNKLRSVLTVLGVMIGVASVIAVVSLVQGMQYTISKDLEGIGTNFIEVYPDPGEQRNPFLQRMPDLTIDDAAAVRRGTTSIKQFTPIYLATAQLKSGDAHHQAQLYAINENYQEIVNHWVQHGRFFTALDAEGRKQVCTVGQEVVEKLKLGANPIGKSILLNNTSFTVVGLMEKKGGTFGNNQDDVVLIPFATATVMFGSENMRKLIQFLIEAIALSGLGGVVGVMGGYALASATRFGLKKYVELPPVHTPVWAILLAFGFCAFLGILFGMYPAAKASKLDPIEALRYE